MYVEHDASDFTETSADDLFGMNPPRGVYFVMEFEHNIEHPVNRGVDPEIAVITSDPQKTMAEARAIAHVTAIDYAHHHGLLVIANDIEYDEEGVDLPSFLGVDQTGFESEENIVFTAMVRMIDYRHETIH